VIWKAKEKTDSARVFQGSAIGVSPSGSLSEVGSGHDTREVNPAMTEQSTGCRSWSFSLLRRHPFSLLVTAPPHAEQPTAQERPVMSHVTTDCMRTDHDTP
jgi:hypothetical protein